MTHPVQRAAQRGGIVRRLALLTALLTAAELNAQLTPEIAVELRRVVRAAVEPGGRYVAYALETPRTADDEPGGPYSEIWIVTLDGGPPRRLTRPKSSAARPAWDPRGGALAFSDKRAEHSEHAQVFLAPIDGGEAEPLTKHPTAVGDFAFSPDGAQLAFVAADEPSAAELDEEKAGRDWRIAGQGERHKRLWIFDRASGESRMAYEDALTTLAFVWSPDGRTLVFRGAETPGADDEMLNSTLYRVPAGGGPVERIAATPGKLGDLEVSPDGRTLAFAGAVSRNDPLPQSLFVVPVAGGEPKSLTPAGEPSSLASLRWIDNGALAVLVNVGLRTELRQIDAASGAVVSVAAPHVNIDAFDLAADGKTLALVASTASHPAELFRGTLGATEVTRLTESGPPLKELRLARQERVEWTSVDDLKIEGLLLHPLDHDPAAGRAALVVNPHGGPEGVSQDGWNVLPQLLAARSFYVLLPNYRGSGGRGVAFSQGDHNDLGGKEFADILRGIDELVQRGLVDPQRVGIGGWSYGGYLSAFAATHHSQRFRAAVMGAGISNWVSFTGTTDIPEEMWAVHWNQPPESDNWRIYWERSPLSRWMDCGTPTLILHGANDDRVPLGQAQEFHWALQRRGVPTELVIYPRAGHGVSERAHRIDCWTRQVEWFAEHLK